MSENVQTIEKTSKKLKLQLVMSTLLLILGIFWGMCSYCYAETFNYEPDFSKSIIIVVSSLIWKYIVKFMIWWNHE